MDWSVHHLSVGTTSAWNHIAGIPSVDTHSAATHSAGIHRAGTHRAGIHSAGLSLHKHGAGF